MSSIDDFYEATGNAPDAPYKKVNDYYPLRNYIKTDQVRSSVHMSNFYDMLTESAEVSSSIQHARKTRSPEFDQIFMEGQEKFAVRKRLNKISSNISGISKKIKFVLGMPNSEITPEERRDTIEELTKQRNDIATRAVKRYWKIFY